MTKIVLNKCYGGFALSSEACELYLQKIGKACFFYKRNKKGELELISRSKAKGFFEVFTSDKFDGKLPTEISRQEYSAYNFYGGDLERDDPVLIEVVKELGSEKSSGDCSRLSITEIPDGVIWKIEEYDGSEWVAEVHRTW